MTILDRIGAFAVGTLQFRTTPFLKLKAVENGLVLFVYDESGGVTPFTRRTTRSLSTFTSTLEQVGYATTFMASTEQLER